MYAIMTEVTIANRGVTPLIGFVGRASKLGHVVIDRDREKLTDAIRRMPEDRRREYAIYGTPEEVRRQVEAFRNAGIECLIVNLESDGELQALELFANEVVKTLT